MLEKKGFQIALIAIGLILTILPNNFLHNTITPRSRLGEEIATLVSGRDTAGVHQLAAACEAAANLFEADSRRDPPLYNDPGKINWAARRINELSLPEGWVMEEKYPGLAQLLSRHIESNISKQPTALEAARVLREIANALKEV